MKGQIAESEDSMKEWNEFKETMGMLIHTVIALLVFPAILFVVVMWGKFLLTVYETVWN